MFGRRSAWLATYAADAVLEAGVRAVRRAIVAGFSTMGHEQTLKRASLVSASSV